MVINSSVAYVFPGQGAQTVGMGKELYDGFASAKAIFDKADDILGFPISKLCFEGPEEDLNLTINTQPAMLTVSVACLEAIKETFGSNFPPPLFVAGHSLGEYTALVAAGVIDFASAVHLARERGRLMNEAGTAQPGGMLAVLGLDEPLLAEVCRDTDTCIANYNCPGQLVVSGAIQNLPQAMEQALAKGANRTVSLQVSGAFHSPLMKPAQESLADIIADITFNEAEVPVIANVTAQPITTGDEIKNELTEQLCNGVQWQRSVEYMIENGVTAFIEIGHGKVLTGLIRRISKAVTIQNIGDAQSINKWLPENISG
ncbi:ACP S-malonyltransferase [Chloroflexota bacterium]